MHYVSQFVSYQSLVTKVIPALLRLSLIQDNPGFIDREFNTGFVSRMKSAAGLIDLFLKHKFQPWMLEVSSEKEVIILKNTEKKFERYNDTDFTRTARQQLQHINRVVVAQRDTIGLGIDGKAQLQHIGLDTCGVGQQQYITMGFGVRCEAQQQVTVGLDMRDEAQL